MIKIKLNNNEYELRSYNKNTTFNTSLTIESNNATFEIITNDVTSLLELGRTQITSLIIYSDNTVIYELQNIDAYIESVSEYLNIDKIIINIILKFK